MARLRALIETDRLIISRFVCVEPQFEKPEAVECLEKELRSVLDEYGRQIFPFRRNKIDLILEWIKAYKLVVNKLPLKYLLSQQQCQELEPKDKPSTIMMSRFSAILTKMHFPRGPFRDRL